MRALNYLLLVSFLLNIALIISYYTTLFVDKRPIWHPFETNYNVTYQSLIKNGYKEIPEDVPLFGKREGDMLIYYQVDYRYIKNNKTLVLKDVLWKNTIMTFHKSDSMKIENFIKKYDGTIISNYENYAFGEYERDQIVINHHSAKKIFLGSIEEFGDSIRLQISEDFPIKKP